MTREHNCIMEPDRIQALRVRANMPEGYNIYI